MENNDDHHQLPPPWYSQHPLPPPPPPPPLLPISQQIRNYLIEEMTNYSDVRMHQFPLSRIKKIMKSDPDVGMVTAEAPILMSKAIEMFIVDLTMQSWLHTIENNRSQTLRRSDISVAVARNLNFSFLVDLVPRAESVATVVADPGFIAIPNQDESVAAAVADPGFVAMPNQDDGLLLPPRMVMGHPVVDCNGMYVQPSQMQAAPGEGEDVAGEIGGSSGGD